MFILGVWYVYVMFILGVWYVYVMFILSVWCVYVMFILIVWHVYVMFILSVFYLYVMFMLNVFNVYVMFMVRCDCGYLYWYIYGIVYAKLIQGIWYGYSMDWYYYVCIGTTHKLISQYTEEAVIRKW